MDSSRSDVQALTTRLSLRDHILNALQHNTALNDNEKHEFVGTLLFALHNKLDRSIDEVDPEHVNVIVSSEFSGAQFRMSVAVRHRVVVKGRARANREDVLEGLRHAVEEFAGGLV